MLNEDNTPQTLAMLRTCPSDGADTDNGWRGAPAEEACSDTAAPAQQDPGPTDNPHVTLPPIPGPSAREKALPYVVAALLLKPAPLRTTLDVEPTEKDQVRS